MVNRRVFIKSSGIALVAGALLPGTFVRIAEAATTEGRRTLVVIFKRGAVDGLNVVVIFEQHTQGVVNDAFGQLTLVHSQQGICPIQCLGYTGWFEQVDLAQLLRGRDDLIR